MADGRKCFSSRVFLITFISSCLLVSLRKNYVSLKVESDCPTCLKRLGFVYLREVELELAATQTSVSRHLGFRCGRRRKFFFSKFKLYPNADSTFQLTNLTVSGDINPNPGPEKCSVCCKTIASNHRALCCDHCDKWCHMKCGNVKPAEYRRYQQLENFNWSCPVCLTVLQPRADSVSFRAETDVSEDDEYPYEMLKNEISAGRGFLKTAHINVNGILTKSKLDEIRLLLRTTGLDILGITESKLTNDVKDEDLDIVGYKFIRRDRPCEDGGGGCLLYYMEDMHLTENPRFLPHDIDNLEAIWVDILFHSQKLPLSVMYRPPKDMSFYDTLDKQLQCIARRRKNIFIMGDLNSDVSMKGNNSDLGRKLLRILNRHGLSNVIKDFTRITDNTRSLIDLSISSDKSKIKKAGTFDTGIADHRLNYCVLHLFRKRSPAKLKTVVDWKNCDIKNFKESLALVPWHNVIYLMILTTIIG